MGGMLCGMADRYDWDYMTGELKLKEDQKNRLMTQNHNAVRKMMDYRNRLSLEMFGLNMELKKNNPDQGNLPPLSTQIS